MPRKRSLTTQGWLDSPVAGHVHYQSGYERKFMLWLDAHNINWIRCKERFPYFIDNKKHTYNPDIYIVDFDMYVEVKGGIRANDPVKFEAFPEDKNLVLLLAEDLKKLNIEVFDPKIVKIVPGKWPSKILEKLPEGLFQDELTKELKLKISSDKFFNALLVKDIR